MIYNPDWNIPINLVHLHDVVFMAGEKVDSYDLKCEFYEKCDPYEKYDPNAWWNQQDDDLAKQIHQNAKIRVNAYLENNELESNENENC